MLLFVGQIVILITGVLSFWLIHDRDCRWRLIACGLALIGQPFWIMAAIDAQQWGILIADLLCTGGWFRGFYRNLLDYND